MIIGKRESRKVQKVYSRRSNEAIQYALKTIGKSEIAPFVKAVYLYGSCARQEQSYGSDVDLLLELVPNYEINTKHVVSLKSELNKNNKLPDIEVKIVIGSDWHNDQGLFYKNIQKEGIKLWG
ncbi:nucleotidyltransferase domain-containing protein [Ruminococcus sp. CLA-AA-H200]|uniref:Nucleotidyltransferase domain-containing protein n=1 Tax=Ruminococcus turbiniformis TaxID=2881258 RepID=A0ABS8FZX9_9FIRM|nr:nucleotidyltransferase domain-containing protein [Ruminococcus turbiniformis]MCC2255561.1 nucleotidyltransferase domain-containing protein [Ruminococcus turbiniformis]